jgi:hypothetical protein
VVFIPYNLSHFLDASSKYPKKWSKYFFFHSENFYIQKIMSKVITACSLLWCCGMIRIVPVMATMRDEQHHQHENMEEDIRIYEDI